ncbi:cellulose-binding protein [Ktedonobacter sp. SOSP1-52]|uniref:cellulose-binding protein n=1 Tax=Ktedonobacter sp. SOSP1-52 TaxID=2778366 RepID=UPI001F363714|nr:cellulose-binding protein [Ktedonobacter sp. SOSP1-52]
MMRKVFSLPPRHGRGRSTLPMMLALIVTFVMLGAYPLSAAAADTPTVQVTVDTHHTLATIPETALGTNAAVWDGHLLDQGVPDLLHNAGVKVIRYPGGSTSDVYHWQSNTTEPNQGYANPNNTFDAFMNVAQATGAQPMITVDYGAGTPQEAADWVQYANKGGVGYTGPVPTYTGGSSTGHTYGIKYWEIGNELYGNGTFGANWEYDLHEKGPVAYANNALQFIQAMKAVDPSIKIGIVLTSPGDWPDSVAAPGLSTDWNNTVLSILGKQIDFADVHWYAQNPGNESDAGLLASTSALPGKVATLKTELQQYSPGKNVPIMITETNSVSYNPGKQTTNLVNALFLASNYMNWLESGVQNVDWWDIHNGIVTWGNNSPTLYGSNQYGDYGLLSTGDSEPPANTPFPTYYSLQMLHHFVDGNGSMVASSTDQSLIEVHAVRQHNGKLALLLINKDPQQSYQLKLAGGCGDQQASATVYFYGQNSSAITVQYISGKALSTQTLPPYSLTTIVLNGENN